MPDPENPNNSIQGGEVESKGIEVDLTLRPVDGLQLLAGYSYNDSKVLKGPKESSFLEEGKRPGEAGPVNLFNAWASYERSEEHTSELQTLMRISYAVFCLKNKTINCSEEYCDNSH